MFVDDRQSYAATDRAPAAPRAAGASGFDLGPYVAAVWARRWRIAAMAAAGMVAAVLIGQLVKPRFTAVAQLLVDPNELHVVDNVLRGQNQLTETHVTQVENQIRVLQSNNVAKRVVERLALDRDPEFIGSGASLFDPRALVRRLFGGDAAAVRHDPALEALDALKRRISARRIERTYVVDASVWAHDPHRAVELAKSLVESFIEEQSVARGDAARRASRSLDTRLVALRARVEAAEKRVEDYKKANGIISSSGTLVKERQVTELNSQLVLARTKSAEARSRHDKIRQIQRSHGDVSAVADVAGSPVITALRGQLAEILRREGEITATLGRRHPAVIEIESQVRRIRRLLDEEVARIAEAARNDMERALANEAMLAANLERLKADLETTNEASVRLRELERELQASRSVYEAFLLRTRQVSEQERLDTTSTRVIAAPELPEHRSFPPRNLVLLIGGAVLGGLLGIALVAFGVLRGRWTDVTAVTAAQIAPPQQERQPAEPHALPVRLATAEPNAPRPLRGAALPATPPVTPMASPAPPSSAASQPYAIPDAAPPTPPAAAASPQAAPSSSTPGSAVADLRPQDGRRDDVRRITPHLQPKPAFRL